MDAFPGETFSGRIARVSPVLDPQTRTAPIEVEIPNPSNRLKPGMYARVGITLDTQEEALVVPATALVDLGGRRGVFQPLSDTAVFRAVQVGSEQGELVEILGGLTDGAEVITTGSGQLRDGDRITIAGRGGRRGEGGGQATGDSASAGTRRGEPVARGSSGRAGGRRQPARRRGRAKGADPAASSAAARANRDRSRQRRHPVSRNRPSRDTSIRQLVDSSNSSVTRHL